MNFGVMADEVLRHPRFSLLPIRTGTIQQNVKASERVDSRCGNHYYVGSGDVFLD